MFVILRGIAVLAVVMGWTATARICTAEPPPATSSAPESEAKPQIAPLRSDLAQILRGWEQAAAGNTRLDCRFTRFKYDHVFEVEYRSGGELAVDRDGRGAYLNSPVVVQRDTVSRRRKDVGKPYDVKADQRERWHWTGSATIRVDELSKTFERVSFAGVPMMHHADRPRPPSLPEDSKAGIGRENLMEWIGSGIAVLIPVATFELDLSGWHDAIRELFIPRSFLLGPHVDEIERVFHIELVKQSPTQVWLSFRPRGPEKSFVFREAVLILNRSDWTPFALKMIEPGRNSETVHVFSDVRINRTDQRAPDLANPDLREFHQLQP